MDKDRLAAFSDGVFAIILTIMVLEMKVPHGGGWADLESVLPVFLSYVLSFLYVGIYWNNHHHLFQVCKRVNGAVLWANLHLLFWLSLLPFVTGWMGENHFSSSPSVLYGVVLLLAAGAYFILQRLILGVYDCESDLAKAFGVDFKGKLSPVLYALGIGLSFVWPWSAGIAYFLVAGLWLVPDRRIERFLAARDESGG